MTARYVNLKGTGPAPLTAGQGYAFTYTVEVDGRARLSIPWAQRGSWDDYGSVIYDEQEAFVWAVTTEVAAATQSYYPGEWVFVDVATLDRVWAALAARICAV